METVQVDSIATILVQLAAAVLLAAGSWGIARFTKWLGLQNNAQINSAMEAALQKSVTYGLQQAQDTIREKGWDHIEVKNQALASALPYMTERFTATLKQAGVDVKDEAALKNVVAQALDRAFPAAAAVAAASPATPPATAPNPAHTAELPPPQGVVVTGVNEQL